MASHNNTPRTILDAPKRGIRWLVQYTSDNRDQRRHFTAQNGKRSRRPGWTPFGPGEAPNQPFRRV